MPVPLIATFCDPAPPPALTFYVAVLDPIEVGLNTTLIVHVAPTSSDVPQVLICENCREFGPEIVILAMGRATVSVFVTVTDCAALATFVVSLPNAKTVGDTVKGGATPVPLSTTVCVPAPLPALTCNVAVFDPVEVGLNTTLIVQAAPTATDVPQVLICENCNAFAPAIAILVTESDVE